MDKRQIKGGVIIIGSLLWEDETNCIQEEKSKELARVREQWRNNNLDISMKSIIPLPLRYGRFSSSRLGTYTMVLSREFLGCIGKGLIVPYKNYFDFNDDNVFKNQIEELALVEGITENSSFGAIAIWINDKSSKKIEIEKRWRRAQSPNFGHHSSIKRFKWSDGKLINFKYQLIDITIDTDLDFLLCTYIQPKHKDKMSKQYPSISEIAAEMERSRYETYFEQNRTNGIKTRVDAKINGCLKLQ